MASPRAPDARESDACGRFWGNSEAARTRETFLRLATRCAPRGRHAARPPCAFANSDAAPAAQRSHPATHSAGRERERDILLRRGCAETDPKDAAAPLYFSRRATRRSCLCRADEPRAAADRFRPQMAIAIAP